MKIGVIGAGAVGGYFGARLARAGKDVVIKVKAEQLAGFKNGIQIISDQEDFSAAGVFTDEYERLKDSDLILFCVKSTGTKEAASQLKPFLKPDAFVLTLQNGVDNEELLTQMYGKARVLSAAAYIQAQTMKPGVVRQIGIPPRLILGAMDSQNPGAVQSVLHLFKDAGIDARGTDDIMKIKWNKYLWNLTFNPLTAILKCKVGTILDDQALRDTAVRICKEAIEVANKAGISIEKLAWQTILEQGEIGRHHETSMLQDVLKGKKLEIDSMTGYAVRKGEEFGVDTPVLSTIDSILRHISQQSSRNRVEHL